MRDFITLCIISLYVKESSAASCWRKCGGMCECTHFLGLPSFSGVLENWQRKKIKVILKVTVPLDPLVFLPGAGLTETCSMDQIHCDCQENKNCKLDKCKITNSNSVDSGTSTGHTMERLTASLQIKKDIFEPRWNCVTIYLGV